MGRLGDHPHIVTVHDIGEEGGLPYIVCQYMAGGSVGRLLAESQDQRLPLDQALPIVEQVCDGLEYAHRRGVIHRDLKPGNIWLSERPGVGGWGSGETMAGGPAPGPWSLTPLAKIGDFGLAIAVDHSRLTQAGMVVGTVAYMAPEQATGGKVTPRSDLYSLGCLLYELVTGRPPFIGDESVAIIGQHLNTPPVAPSWHRPDCPPGLEALIFRLLEKDPTKRPQSAGEVRLILQSTKEAPSSQPSPAAGGGGSMTAPSPQPQADPLYRRTFVGRENEVRQLRSGFDASASGQGTLLMVVGEPGIGKTALCEQLATYAGLRGGKVLVGHCYEEGSLSLPYLPFVEALRSYVLGREPDRLREELGTGAADIARIVSEIRDLVEVAVRPASDPEDDRWRLFQAVTDFLRNAASVQPILLVLEDLHWADRGTLDYLVHLSRNLQGARLLVVGTYRDVEVDRAHPLSGTLAELRRTGDLLRVLLRGLTVDEVHRMINALQSQEVRWSFAEAVHRQTEGSPLFIQEVLRYLVEEGLVVRREGRWEGRWRQTGEGPPELSIPEGLRDVVGKRLSRLSQECNRLLTVAAVIGREFSLEVLRRVARIEEEEALGNLEEGLKVGVLEEQARVGGVLYRFAHAFFRQTLYEELSAARRIRLHQEVARELEEVHARRLDDHAPELAEHFSHSSDPADLEKAVHYGELGARRAVGVFAYGEAVRLLERAIEVQEVLDPDDRARRCDLLLALGDAQMPLGEPRKVADLIAPDAFALAEELGDSARAGRACRIALEGLHREDVGNVGTPEFAEWAERAGRWAPPATVDRAYADIALGRVRVARRRVSEGVELLRDALALARQLADPELLFSAAWQNIRVLSWHDFSRAFVLAQEFIDRPRVGVSSRTQGQILEFCGATVLVGGERERGEQALRELSAVAERTRDAFVQINARSWEAVLAALDGRLEDALELRTDMLTRAQEQGTGLPFIERGTRRALILRGQAEPVVAGVASGADVLALCYAGDREQASKALHGTLRRFLTESGEVDPQAWRGNAWMTLLEAATLLKDRRAIDLVIASLEGLPPIEPVLLSCAPHWAGRAMALRDDRDRALAHYREALDICQRIRYRPEIALIHLDLAELLLEEALSAQPSAVSNREGGVKLRADQLKAEALEHLDFAIPEFEAMKMPPSLEQAQALRQKLNA